MEVDNNQPESKEPQKSEVQENPQQKSFRKGNYNSYDNSPFAPYERSQFYQEDFINDRVEQRMRMQEKAAEKIDLGITNKDKFITINLKRVNLQLILVYVRVFPERRER